MGITSVHTRTPRTRVAMKILFLDIDGVLNGHDWMPRAESNTIRYWFNGMDLPLKSCRPVTGGVTRPSMILRDER